MEQVHVNSNQSRFASGSIRVLVVDDDANTCQYLCELLMEAGCDATAVASGEEAIQRYGSECYSLVIMDIIMPGKNGVEAIMDIRRSFPQARFIAITGRPGPEGIDMLNDARKMGAQRVLRKPFTPDELLYAMAAALG